MPAAPWGGPRGEAARPRSPSRARSGRHWMGLTYQPPLAGLGARLLAVILDTLVAFAFMLPGFAFIAYGVLLDPRNPSITAAAFGVMLTWVLSMALLGVLFVMWAQGQTPGKRILGLRVIKLD